MIDVVVPVYKQPELVYQCLDALMHQQGLGKLIVVDDASNDQDLSEYLSFLAAMDKVTIIANDENRGFVHSANLGMKEVSSLYAVIINSDTIPLKPNSLYELVAVTELTAANVGGPKLLFMEGSGYGKAWTIQHAGVGFNPDGVPYHPFMHLHRKTAAANVQRKVHAVTGAVFCVKVETWNELGGFDEAFSPGVYEDVDYCLRAKTAMYVPTSEWLHLMHGSQTKDNNLFDHHNEHLATLLSRWGRSCDEYIFYGV